MTSNLGNDVAACAHLRVSWRTCTVAGLTRGWWECDYDCGAKFELTATPAPATSEGREEFLDAARRFREQWSHKPTPISPEATGLWYSVECVDQMLADFAGQKRTYCHLCGKYFDGSPEWHGLGECVEICSRCLSTEPEADGLKLCKPCGEVELLELEIKNLQASRSSDRERVEELEAAAEHLGIAKKRLNAIVGEGENILPLISRVEAMAKHLHNWNRVMSLVLAGSEYHNNPAAYVDRFRQLGEMAKSAMIKRIAAESRVSELQRELANESVLANHALNCWGKETERANNAESKLSELTGLLKRLDDLLQSCVPEYGFAPPFTVSARFSLEQWQAILCARAALRSHLESSK